MELTLAIIGFGMVCSESIAIQLLGIVVFVLSLNKLGKEIEESERS